MLYRIFWILLNCIEVHNNVLHMEKDLVLLMRLQHTFGVKTEIYYKFLKNCIFLIQSDNENKIIAKMDFKIPIKNNIFCTFVKKQKIGKLSLKINVKYNNNNNLKVYTVEKQDKIKIKKVHTIMNLYTHLDTLNNIDIRINNSPNYYTLCNTTPLIDIYSQEFYETYYKMMGVNKKNTPEVSFNDTKTYTMGDILGTFGAPTMTLFSGDGCETLIYTGFHQCNNIDEKRFYFAIMVVHCDIYSKVIKLLYHIQLCPICHSNICMNTSNLQIIT